MKLSVIIPNYNNERFLLECLESLEKQNLKDFEIIIIDDGSTDKSINIINEYQSKTKLNLKVFRQFNMNASIARNKGIEMSSGEFIYFLDSDDYLNDNSLEKMISNIEDSDLVIGNYNIVDEDSNKISDYVVENFIENYDDNVYKFCNISPVPSNKLYRKTIIEENNLYFANVRVGQDLNFFLKYISVCKKIKIIDEYIYNYRIVQTGMSLNKSYNMFDIYYSFKNIKEYYHLLNKDKEYNKYIVNEEYIHYHYQMTKLLRFKSKKIRKSIFNFFTEQINQIDLSNAVYNKELKIKKIKFEIEKIFAFLFTSNLFYNIVCFIRGQKKGKQ